MATRPVAVRVPDHMYDRLRALRPYVAVAADVPRGLHDVTMSDVLTRVLALGLDVMEGHRKVAMARGDFSDAPSR